MLFPDTEGDSSSNACHQNYRGPTPLSDPESVAIKEFVFKNRKTIKLFVSLHSYGQVRHLFIGQIVPEVMQYRFVKFSWKFLYAQPLIAEILFKSLCVQLLYFYNLQLFSLQILLKSGLVFKLKKKKNSSENV